MPHRRGRAALLGLVVVLLVGVVLVAAGVGADAGNTVAQDAAENASQVRGPHGAVRAWGVDPASARPVLRSEGGAVSVAEGDKAACLLRDDENDHCYPKAQIVTGLGFSITNDCSSGGDRAMIVRGFGPKGAAAVAVVYSDGSVPLEAGLVESAFFFTAITPAKGEPYPVTVRYLDAGGQELRSLPIKGGDNLCLEAR